MNYLGVNGNSELIKKINMEKIYKTILIYRPISRARIASLTGINKVTVSSTVDYFLDKGILHELETSSKNVGRPPIYVDISGNSGVMVGIELDIYNCRILVTDLTGQKLEYNSFVTKYTQPESFLSMISKLIEELIVKYLHYKLGVIGVGVALPGNYNDDTGEIEYLAKLPNWIGFPIKSELTKVIPDTPIFIITNASAGALGEIHFGKSSVSEHLAYINGSWGLGVRLCSIGSILSGASGLAGRLGHSIIQVNGKKCSCGNRGCWEAYASFKALHQQLYSPEAPEITSVDVIVDGLNNQDAQVVSAVQDLIYYLSIGLVTVVNAYNPSEICIGSTLSHFGTYLSSKIEIQLKELLPKHLTNKLNIYCSDLGELGGAYGAISIVRNNLPSIVERNVLQR